MTTNFAPREICQLASSILDSSATDEGLAQIESILTASAEARQYYYQLIALHSRLTWAMAESGAEAGLGPQPGAAQLHQVRRKTCCERRACHRRGLPIPNAFGLSEPGRRTRGKLAVVAEGIGADGVGQPGHILRRSDDFGRNRPRILHRPACPGANRVAGRGAGANRRGFRLPMAGSAPRADLGGKLATGTSRLAAGIVELEFDGGAACASKVPPSSRRDRASAWSSTRGRLVAYVPKPARGFTVVTPTAEVIDLGTEFGVNVGQSGDTDVEVLRGTVEVNGTTARPSNGATFEHIRLHAGQAMRADAKGLGPIVKSTGQTSLVQALPNAEIKSLDLVDIVAGGDGCGRRRNLGVDPENGHVILAPSTDYSRFGAWLHGDGEYHRTVDRPLIDGVAIPAPGSVQLDSAGHIFEDFPKTNGKAYGPVWAGGSVPQVPGHPVLRSTFDGTLDYADEPHGLIGMIPNKLITFDLEAIRRVHPGKLLAVFARSSASRSRSARRGSPGWPTPGCSSMGSFASVARR